MTREVKPGIEAHWDKNVCPANEKSTRGLLVEMTVPSNQKEERRPINLSLVIDRSGSMSGQNIEAAKEAAMGVVNRLGDKDMLSVVAFDDQILTLISGTRMSKHGKDEAREAIARLQAGGMTDLGGGWFQRAKLAADVMERANFSTGHIVLLSDGHANQGLTDPDKLFDHARELAGKGITTSTVGVGNNYSPLQLDALAEGGNGRLHDAVDGADIVSVILGELGEIQSVVIENADLIIRWADDLKGELKSRLPSESFPTATYVKLGQLTSGAQRTVPMLFQVPALPVGTELKVYVNLIEKDAQGLELGCLSEKLMTLHIVPGAEAEAAPRDVRVAKRISLIWESQLGFDAMVANEQGDYVGASDLLCASMDSMATFSKGTGVEDSIQGNLNLAARRVSRPWDGRSKRDAMIAAKKFGRNERDYKSSGSKDWSDNLKD